MNDFMYERVKKITQDLQELICLQSVKITDWQMKEGFFLTPQEADSSSTPWQSFNTNTDFWHGIDNHYWFRTEITVPESFGKKPLHFSCASQYTDNLIVNPQFLLFVGGEPIQGMDSKHILSRITRKAKAGAVLKIDVQAYTGTEVDINKGCTEDLKLCTSIKQLDPAIDELYYNLNVPNRIVSQMQDGDLNKIRLQSALEKAINILDLRVPYSDEFYDSVTLCNKFLQREVYKKLAGSDDVVATCIGHTHIDVAWWWTVDQTREKVVRSFSTVLKLMEEYPEYKFMSSQPQLYKFLKQRYPEIYEQIKVRVKEGRWEVEGGMWVEADCNVTSGESLVRQFLHGKKFFKDEFDKDNKILWLPDVFGYSAALPQILKKSGIDYFMTTKISWNQFNQLPYDTFWWRGIDGTDVFTHLITTQDTWTQKDNFFTTYNGELDPVCLMKGWDRYQQKDINNDILISYGYGDGGGGPNKEMIETGIRMQSGINGSPKVRLETSRKYFDELYERCAENNKLPHWVGELYLEYHRGTYTSMARNKRANRKNEILWQDVEFFCVFASLLGIPFDSDELYDKWEIILMNQFHDILPGSSIKEVYEVTKVEYADLEKRGHELIDERITAIANKCKAKPNDLILFNTLSFDREDAAIVPIDGFHNVTSFKDEDGVKYPAQQTYDNKLVFCPPCVPSKGYAVYTPCIDNDSFQAPITVNSNEIDTPYYHITLDKCGQFESLFDKRASRELLKKNEKGNVLRVYEDKPIYFDNWDIDTYYKEKSWVVDDVAELSWIEAGPVRSVLQIKRGFLQSTIIQKIIFYADSARIDFDSYVDWKQHQLLLKCEFPVDINTAEATYDIQFGNLKRPTHQNTSWDVARFEVCGHKWADLSEGGYGVALLNDCKYGYGITDNKMTLSLVKSGILPNPDTDYEEHFFTYSLLPHNDSLYDSDVAKEGYCLNTPMYPVRVLTPECSFDTTSLMSIDSDNVIIETVKPAQDNNGIIVRMYENQNKRTSTTLRWHDKFISCVECDLMENPIGSEVLSESEISFTIKPFEVKTFRIV